jgi:hypothetical protein
MPTPKLKEANSTSTEPVVRIAHSGITPSSSFFAPTPLAMDARPVRTQAA